MPAPGPLDFAALADGIVRNNVGVDGIELRVRGRVEGAELVIEPTGQRVPLLGTAPASTRPWQRVSITRWGAGETPAATWLGEADDPAAFDRPGS